MPVYALSSLWDLPSGLLRGIHGIAEYCILLGLKYW